MAIYACSDLHGCLNAYKKIKECINPEDKVYCLGDCGDRGPEPWDTIKAVLTDPQFIYIKGNHEDMLVKAVYEVFDTGWSHLDAQKLLASNGGMNTLNEILGEESPERWTKQLAQLPVSIELINSNKQNIKLCHAGCSIWKDEKTYVSTRELLWDRLHYFDNADLLDDTIVVHGHTPIKYLAEDIGVKPGVGALKYANGKKYCIDAGTFFTDQVILFNLDTFESIVFRIND